VLLPAREEPQLVREADGGWDAAPAGFGVRFELGAEGAWWVEYVQRRQPRAAARAVHALPHAAEPVDDLLRWPHRAFDAVRPLDVDVYFDVPPRGPVLRSDLLPVGPRGSE
jgi:hypothetical protein